MQKLVKSDWPHVSVGDLLIHQPLGFSYHKAVVCVVTKIEVGPMVEDPIRLRVFLGQARALWTLPFHESIYVKYSLNQAQTETIKKNKLFS